MNEKITAIEIFEQVEKLQNMLWDKSTGDERKEIYLIKGMLLTLAKQRDEIEFVKFGTYRKK